MLTFVIPAYNAEFCIERLLYSIKYFQPDSYVLIVDDCSTDNTADIAFKSLSSFKLQGTVIQTNRNIGLSGARNFGLKFVKTKYVWFIDSDDYLCGTLAIDEINGEDVILVGGQDEGNVMDYSRISISGKGSIILRHLTSQNRYFASACMMVIRKGYLDVENPFKTGIYEDEIFTFELFLKNGNFKSIPDTLYYRTRDFSNLVSSFGLRKRCYRLLRGVQLLYCSFKYNSSYSISFFRCLSMCRSAILWQR